MASTRNKNTPGNYCLEQRQDANAAQYALYPNSQYGCAFNTRMPGNGFRPAQIPGNKMSYNAPDIESFLFGINSTNLVKPAPCFVPELKQLSSSNLFLLEPPLMPEPLVIPKNQRPLPVPER
jgi:hypothetical protein